MEIHSVHAEQKLAHIAQAIGRSPKSWSGWHCLLISLKALTPGMQQDVLIWTKSIMNAFLNDAKGRVYFCENESIHIFVKNIDYGIMHQTALHILDLAYAEAEVMLEYDYFELQNDGVFYAQYVLENLPHYHALPIDRGAGAFDTMLETVAIGYPQRSAGDIRDLGPSAVSMDTKIMLVEDDPVTRWLVRNALKERCTLVTAGSASKAYELFPSFAPDIVFLDIGLPDESGCVVLEWLLKKRPHQCVVMFSGTDNLDNISGALEMGARGFIAKPFLKEQLYHYIRTYQPMASA